MHPSSLLTLLLVSVGAEDAKWTWGRYVDSVKDWVAPTQSPVMSTTTTPTTTSTTLENPSVLLDPQRDRTVNKAESWLHSLKQYWPGGIFGGNMRSHEISQTSDNDATVDTNLWHKMKDAWESLNNNEKPTEPPVEKKKSRSFLPWGVHDDSEHSAEDSIKEKNKRPMATQAPPGNVPKKPSEKTKKNVPKDPTLLIPSSQILDHWNCRPVVSFLSCVEHCEQLVLSDESPISRRLSAVDESDMIEDSENSGGTAIYDFLGPKNDTAGIGKQGDRSPRIGGLFKKSDKGWDTLQANQLKSCWFNVCVVDYIKSSIPGCIGPDGNVVPVNLDPKDIRDPDLRPGHPETFQPIDFYNPNRLEMWRSMGVFKWQRFWHELSDQGVLRRLLFVPLVLIGIVGLPVLLMVVVLQFFGAFFWRGEPSQSAACPDQPQRPGRFPQQPAFCAALLGRTTHSEDDGDWRRYLPETMAEIRSHPGLVAQRAGSWLFIRAADPTFRAIKAVRDVSLSIYTGLISLTSLLPPWGSSEYRPVLNETELSALNVAGPLLDSDSKPFIPPEEPSVESSTVPTVPDVAS